MYLIVEKDTDFIIVTTNSITDNNDGTFVDDYDEFLYSKDISVYYYIDMETLPKGVRLGTHGYNPEKGFYQLITPLELNELRHLNRTKLKRQISIEQMFIEMSEKIENIFLSQEAMEYMFNQMTATEYAMFITYIQMNNIQMIENEKLHSNIALIAYDLMIKEALTEEDIPQYLLPYLDALQKTIDQKVQEDKEKNETILSDTNLDFGEETIIENHNGEEE